MKTNLPSCLTSLTLVLLLGAIAAPSLAAQENPSRRPAPRSGAEEPKGLERLGRFLFKQSRKLEVSQQTSAKVRPVPASSTASGRSSGYQAGAPQGMVLTNRSNPAGSTVIYRAPAPELSPSSVQTIIGPDGTMVRRILQPGEAATVEWQSRPAGEWQHTETSGNAELSEPTVSQAETSPSLRSAQPPRPLIDKASLPVAKWSATIGRVISPFEPYNELDVAGLPAGSMARDPSSGKIFRLP